MPSKPGHLFHKAGCSCRACSGKAEALPVGAGGEATPSVPPEDVIHADSYDPAIDGPLLVTQTRTKKGRVREWLSYRALYPSMTNNEIAGKLGISPHTLNDYIRIGVKEGWLNFSDPLERIEHDLIPQVVDNLSHFLKNRDKQVTIETAKGTVFKTFEQSKGISAAPVTVLALKIEAVDPTTVKAITGQIVGKPRTLEIEAIDVEAQEIT